jgi:hypothetical protein
MHLSITLYEESSQYLEEEEEEEEDVHDVSDNWFKTDLSKCEQGFSHIT